MLSRTAANLYWLGRHIERADFLCRLVDATSRQAALPASQGGAGSAWQAALEAATAADGFVASGRIVTEETVGHYLAVDPINPNAIRSCLERARANGRTVRTALTGETWEAVNSAWIEVQRFGVAPLEPTTLVRLVEAVKQALLAVAGAAHRSQLRDPPYWFFRLGTAIERADNTARLLDVKYHILLPRTEPIGGSLDYSQWTTLLRTVSALTAYRWVYRDAVKPWLVADLLILQRAMPRSLIACYEDAVYLLDQISGPTGRRGPAHRRAMQGLRLLAQTDIDTLFQSGLHEFLVEFLDANNALGTVIAEQYLF